MAEKNHLLVVDGQFDFCDPRGALYVPGADDDMKRLSAMIIKGRDKIEEITATMDTHRKRHIANPIWWVDPRGNHPAPFTQIDYDDVSGRDPKWRSSNPEYNERSISYVKRLKENNRYVLTVWPPHCLVGSNGHKIYPELYGAFDEWEGPRKEVKYMEKGVNRFTEHYSAVKADVADEDDESTGLNTALVEALLESDIIGIAGEALSHCVANTVRDVAEGIEKSEIKKFVLLEDASSPVSGFESLGMDFIRELTGLGMRTAKTTDFPG